ncbi:MAG: TolC family protein [Deltaproteobacteria bacterium]|nr:TolC family protein [Deltaproteobacteria bacterium]
MRFRALPTLFCPAIVLVLSMAALPALGTDPTRTGLAAPRSYPGPGLHGELELALADAIAMGLENNLNVEIQRHAPLIAHEDARMAMGIYDPEWFSEMGWQHVKNPNAFTLNLTLLNEEKTLDGIGGFRGLVPWLGATYSATLESGQVETNSTLQSRSPEYRSAVVFSGSIPLMKGLIWSEPWTLVKTTQVLYQGSTEEFRRNVMDIVQQIEDAYWALIANDELVRVAEKSVETAQALLDQVQIQYEVGVVSKVEIAQAEAGLAAREFDLIVAQNRYQTTMDVLIDLVLGSNLTADSRIQIVPTDRPDALVSYDVDVEEAARIAFQRRPELALAQKDIERLEINVKFAKNQRLPQFDIQSFYRMEGLGGSQNPNLIDFTQDPPGPAAPGTVPERSWGSTFDNFFTSKAADSYGIRGFLSIPIPNTIGRRGVSKAQLELRRARVAKRRVEQTIILEIRKAARDLVSAHEGIGASERQVVAAAEQLRAERIRLEYGESTPFDVLLKEQELVSAQQGKIDAFRVYRSSVTGLDRSQGTILRNRNVSIDQTARLR